LTGDRVLVDVVEIGLGLGALDLLLEKAVVRVAVAVVPPLTDDALVEVFLTAPRAFVLPVAFLITWLLSSRNMRSTMFR
jgi:hypothetical protein